MEIGDGRFDCGEGKDPPGTVDLSRFCFAFLALLGRGRGTGTERARLCKTAHFTSEAMIDLLIFNHLLPSLAGIGLMEKFKTQKVPCGHGINSC